MTKTETILKTAETQLTEELGFPVTLKIRKSQASQIERLKEAICEAFHLPWSEITSPRKKEDRPLARAIFCYIGTIEMGLTLQSIADILGHKDHTAVIYHRNTVMHRLDESDRLVVSKFNRVKEFLND